MIIQFTFAHPGSSGGVRELVHPAAFERLVELQAMPTIGEAIAFEAFVALVTWVLWRPGGVSEAHVEVKHGYTLPRQEELRASGWVDD